MPIAAFSASAPEPVFQFLGERVSARDRAHWKWKYRLDAGDAARAFYAQSGDGQVTGFIGMLPTTLHAKDRTFRAAWFVDWATGAGGVGAGVGLLRQAQRTVDVLLTLQGSPDTQEILPRLKWQRTDRPGHWVLPVSARALASRAAKGRSDLLGLPIRLAGSLGKFWFRVTRPPAGAFSLQEVDRFPESYDAVWAERASEFAPLMSRSSEQLNFMAADYPDDAYRCFLVLDEGKPCGHLVLRVDTVKGQMRGRIVDLLWARGRAGQVEWLVREAAWHLQEAGCDTIEVTASVPDLEQALTSARFSKRRSVPIWWDRSPEGVPGPDHWYITFFDCDRAYR